MKCDYCHKESDQVQNWGELDKNFCGKICLRKFKAREWVWEYLPPGYERTKFARLPNRPATTALFKSMHAQNLADEYETFGHFVYGSTGSGKTRSLYLLIQLVGFRWFHSVKWLRGAQFGKEVIERTRPHGTGGFETWFAELCDPDESELLVIDEADKIRFSERVSSEFFELIEQRTTNYCQTVLVSNSTAADLVSKMPEEYRGATLRRIQERLIPVNFDL